jgi:glycosyltransferase involved in cell wall biosynthesis
MSDVTIVVLTKNEEKNIAAVVQNAKKVAAEVLIVDSGSTDKTVPLAEKMVQELFIVPGIMTFQRSAILRCSM